MAKKATEKKTETKATAKAADGFELNETKAEDAMTAKNIVSDGRLPKVVGLLFILISVFLGIAFASYMFTWKIDQDKVFQYSSRILFSSDKFEVANKLGRLGAFISHQFFFNGIGIASFAFVIIFFTWGMNLLNRRRIFPVIKILQFSVLGIVWLTTLLSFALPTAQFPWGGAMGDATNDWLQGFAGWSGTALILAAGLLAFLILMYNIGFYFKIPSFRKNKPEEFVGTENESNIAEVPLDNTLTHEAENMLDYFQTEKVEEKDAREKNIFAGIKNDDGVSIEFNPGNPPLEVSGEAELEDNEFALAIDKAKPKAKKTADENVELDVAPVKVEEKMVAENRPPPTDKYDPTLDLSHYNYPTLELLNEYTNEGTSVTKEELEQNKNQIVTTLRNYGIEIDKIKATIGPTVTLYEIVPAAGVRISKIKNLEDDIALSLSALGIRIIAPIPGKGTIGIEVPNIKKEMVSMRSLLASEKYQSANMDLPIALGKNISNENIVLDLAKMPHLLMAGATGQGKSVGLNAILVSLLYKKHPSQLKFVMVDPKKVELSIYKVIEKHFLAKLPNEEDPIITDTKKVVATLNSLCIEMDRRYDMLKEATCRNLKEYNQKFVDRRLNPQNGHEFLPYIVVVIDEFADLIMTAGKEVEMPIARIAQLARAVGIHLIIATQRPSVNIITGTIKANFPARIAFKVSSKIDSRTILDAGGADQLIGKGDMLISNGGELIRVQCAFCDTPEIEKIVEYISEQQGYPSAHLLPEYIDPNEQDKGDIALSGEKDEYFEEAAKVIVATQQGSTSMIQRKLKLGYNRAGRIMDQLEAAGVVGPSQGSKAREVKFKTEADLMQVLSTM